jgi:Holliday junction resolvase
MPIGTGYGSSGVPDFLACHEGHFIGIEAKAGKGKTTALQEDNMRRIRESGGTTIVVNEDNMVELLTLLGAKND